MGCEGLNFATDHCNGNDDLYRFDKSNGTWGAGGTLANAPVNMKKGSDMTLLGSSLYVVRGNNKNDFYRYDIGSNTWVTLVNTPANTGKGTSIVTDGTDLYLFRGKNTTNVCESWAKTRRSKFS
jgi:N-acetylneuraminic acid mutarotase